MSGTDWRDSAAHPIKPSQIMDLLFGSHAIARSRISALLLFSFRKGPGQDFGARKFFRRLGDGFRRGERHEIRLTALGGHPIGNFNAAATRAAVNGGAHDLES